MGQGRNIVNMRNVDERKKFEKGYKAVNFTGNFQVKHFKAIFLPWNLQEVKISENSKYTLPKHNICVSQCPARPTLGFVYHLV